MTPQQLKNSVLQLAMQGRLVEQRPEEGTGEELYQRIQKEKQKLIQEGKIKKQKKLPAITEDEIPFEIPESWKWVRLGDISNYAQSKKKISPNNITPDMWSLDLEDIEKESGRILAKKFAKDRKIRGDKVCFQKGNILYSKLRPYLLKILIAPEDGITSPEMIPFNIYGCSDQKFFLWILRSPFVNQTVNAESYGVKMPRVGTATMVNLPIPLPPLDEQKRIVAKIEELLPYLDRYSKAYDRLETYNQKFPVDLRKSILQEAIQGKLVSQDPNDEPVSVLLEKIHKEKQRLIKEGKIKKQKALPPIMKEEIPFEIPESWQWVRWGDVVNIVSARRVYKSDWKSEGIPFYRAREIAKLADGGSVDNELFISQDLYAELSKSGVPHSGDLMVTAVGTLGKTYIVQPKDKFYYKDASVICFENYGNASSRYLKLVMESELMNRQIKKNSSGTTVSTLTIVRMSNYLLPLPPLAEQVRIVTKVDEILPFYEQIMRG